jgi:hypothetical protein
MSKEKARLTMRRKRKAGIRRKTRRKSFSTSRVIVTDFNKLGAVEEFKFVMNSASVASTGNGAVYINRACMLSFINYVSTSIATVVNPKYGSVLLESLALDLPGFIPSAATEPTNWVINFLSDTGDNDSIGYSNPSSEKAHIELPIPPKSRAAAPSRSLANNLAVEGPGVIQALAENLFSIQSFGVTNEEAILTVRVRASSVLGSSAIVTTTAPGIVGPLWFALDNISPTSTGGASAYPTLTVGTWLIIPMALATQAILTKPAAFTRSVA